MVIEEGSSDEKLRATAPQVCSVLLGGGRRAIQSQLVHHVVLVVLGRRPGGPIEDVVRPTRFHVAREPLRFLLGIGEREVYLLVFK